MAMTLANNLAHCLKLSTGGDPSSVECLVGLYTSAKWKELLSMPLLDAKYPWRSKIIWALILYCQFHLEDVNRHVSRSEVLAT